MVTNDALYDDNLNNVFLGSMTNSALLIAVFTTVTVVVDVVSNNSYSVSVISA